MVTSSKADWLIPSGLLTLSLVPAVVGIFRIIQLGSGAEGTPEASRFFAEPLPVVLHIFSSLTYCILGAFQFSPGFRRGNPPWHRLSGRVSVPMGLIASLSGLWLTQFFPPGEFDGAALHAIRLWVGIGMTSSLWLGMAAIYKRDIAGHRVWMMRAYALGIGAGTQVFTHIPIAVFPDIQGELARTICMTAGWVINIAVVEWLIVRERRRQIVVAPSIA